jgi:hypothetical protein
VRARLSASHIVARDLSDVRRADLPHDRDELDIQDLQHAVDIRDTTPISPKNDREITTAEVDSLSLTS